jgi:hypothetical protein
MQKFDAIAPAEPDHLAHDNPVQARTAPQHAAGHREYSGGHDRGFLKSYAQELGLLEAACARAGNSCNKGKETLSTPIIA